MRPVSSRVPRAPTRRRAPGLRLRHYLGLCVLVVVLGWKLLRGISPSSATWHLHLAATAALAAVSALMLLKSRLRLRKSDLSFAVFVFCLLVALRTVVFQNYTDAFTAATLPFFGFFVLKNAFARVGDREFFDGLAFVLAALAAIEVLAIVEYANDWGIVDYSGMEAMEGMAPIEGRYGGKSFILFFLDLEILQRFWGRLTGVSGTPYASGGLMSAIAIFGLASRRFWLTALAGTAMLLSSTGSAVLALFVSAAILYRKRPAMYVPLLALAPFLLLVFSAKGITAEGLREVYLPVHIHADAFHFLLGAVIGEGQHVGSIGTEFRILSTLFSLGIVGVACLAVIAMGWRRLLRSPMQPDIRREYRAAGYFVLSLLVSTLHYPTLFIYPNIVFVVAFIALASSRLAWLRREVEARSGPKLLGHRPRGTLTGLQPAGGSIRP